MEPANCLHGCWAKTSRRISPCGKDIHRLTACSPVATSLMTRSGTSTSVPMAGRCEPRERSMIAVSGTTCHNPEPSAIPSSFWTLKGIEFDKSSAHNDNTRYCHITCPTRQVLAIFPGERQTVSGVQRVGDSFVLDELAEKLPANSVRGRPSYPWDDFHIEVAAMIRDGMLPQKKEAAIHHFQ